ncbi:hypothetical protein, partial [Pseudomonas sp. 100_A]|uniref:hypothetical protein n=1 Tax=Pseudomonas sp. 100_A TaxID=2813571 RepID=UPI001A9F5EA0
VPQVIRAAVHAAAQLRVTHGAERRALQEIVLNLRHPDGRLKVGVSDYDDTYQSQAAIFRRGQDDGDIRPELDPLTLAVTYQGAVDAMLTYLDAHTDVDPDRYADTVAGILLDGAATHD